MDNKEASSLTGLNDESIKYLVIQTPTTNAINAKNNLILILIFRPYTI
jgi:hypothetical protein